MLTREVFVIYIDFLTHCCQTLANLKSASLVNLSFEKSSDIHSFAVSLNEILNKKGVYVKILKQTNCSALIYVYRKRKLGEYLNQREVSCFLKEFGYDRFDVDYCLDLLCKKLLLTNDFPHEIGVFLDYPLEDVRAFIKFNGKNYKTVGYWKVYFNENTALKTFERFKKCKEVYLKQFLNGRSLIDLTVAA